MNSPVQPGIATDIDQSSPVILCHSFVAIDSCEDGIEFKISSNRSAQWAGRQTVLLIVSINQPMMILLVVQQAPPFLSCLMEAGSWRCTESLFPCTRPQKSSTYISVIDRCMEWFGGGSG